MNKEAIKTLMQEIPMLKALETEERNLLLDYMEYKKEPEGSVIIKEGETGSALYFIVSGEVEISVHTPFKSEPPLVQLGKGEIVGEMAIISLKNIRSATVTALSEVELLILSKKSYEQLIEKHNQVAFKVLRSITSNLCERIKEQSASIVALRLFQ